MDVRDGKGFARPVAKPEATNTHIWRIPLRAILLTTLLLVGCAENPADNKPVAQVSSATASASPAPATVGGVRYTLNPETSKVGWVGSKVTGSHDGGFNKFMGEITVVEDNPEKSSVNLEIDAESIFSDDAKLTTHLKSADFFDVSKFPQASFKSTAITKAGEGYSLAGDLTMHGVTKNISFPAQITLSPEAVTAKAEFSINRGDFGITYKGKADNLIREEVVIKLDLNAPKAQ